MLQVKEFKFAADLPGISLKSIEEHLKLYQGYVKKVNEIREKLQTADKSEANATYSFIGELKREETFALNGARLHENYFAILGGDGEAKGVVAEMIAEKFGSVEKWIEEMTAAGMTARGWAITVYDIHLKELSIVTTDTQNLGPVFSTVPVIALDVYEHAYFMDYGTARKSYIEAFFKNLDWGKIDELASHHGIK